eukprot:TRINITY_DN5999_c0_g1_i2.p1 TRINITY_DN5999_c0_g1~~TRINITY_DN5999_c0_g1_i2.p1  ORF type:complete len:610 (-),score=170.62 TRINITY_DN5999_c0_g1_i2:1205-3034(-)
MLVNSESKMLCAAAVHLVSFDGTPNIPQTGQAFLKDLFKIKKPVKTVPIIGLARRGKSVFHNCFINCPANVKGFAVSHSFNSCTKGLWALAREMEEHILLCVDVEGMFAPDAKTDNDEKIATLVCLMSSVLLYNASTPINTMELSKLQFVSEYGAVVIRDGKRPPLPPIVFLLRDNVCPEFNTQQGVNAYLETNVKHHLPHFPSVHARTIPRPATNLEEFNRQHPESPHLHASKEYRAAVAEVFRFVETLPPRIMNNQLLPSDFKALLEDFVRGFGQAKFPEPYNRVSELLIPKAVETIKTVFGATAAHLSLDTGNLGYGGQGEVFFRKQVEICSLFACFSMVEGWLALLEKTGDKEVKSSLPQWARAAINRFETPCPGAEVYTVTDWCKKNMSSLKRLDWSFVHPYSAEIAAQAVGRVQPWINEQSFNFKKIYDSGVRQKAAEEEAAAREEQIRKKAAENAERLQKEAAAREEQIRRWAAEEAERKRKEAAFREQQIRETAAAKLEMEKREAAARQQMLLREASLKAAADLAHAKAEAAEKLRVDQQRMAARAEEDRKMQIAMMEKMRAEAHERAERAAESSRRMKNDIERVRMEIAMRERADRCLLM